MSRQTTPATSFIIPVLCLCIVILGVLTIRLNSEKSEFQKKVMQQSGMNKVRWQEFYFGYENSSSFRLQYPSGWTLPDGNFSRYIVFLSPNYSEKSQGGTLKVLTGAEIFFSEDSDDERDLAGLQSSLQETYGAQNILFDKSWLLGQPALWHREIDQNNMAVSVVTVKDKKAYKMLLLYNPDEKNTEEYYAVFNKMVGSVQKLH